MPGLDPGSDPQLKLDALVKAGCERVFVEKASGAQRDRPELKAVLGYSLRYTV